MIKSRWRSRRGPVLFICHLRHVFDRAGGGVEGLSTIVLATGVGEVASPMLGWFAELIAVACPLIASTH